MKKQTFSNKNILIPRNIDRRNDMLRQANIKLLSQEVIEGDLEIDMSFLDIPKELIRVKIVNGDISLDINVDTLPEWLNNIKKVKGDFYCSFCGIKSLKNCPQWIGGSFHCGGNDLISLYGCPKYIGRNFMCHSNKSKLTLPDGIEIRGNFVNVLDEFI